VTVSAERALGTSLHMLCQSWSSWAWMEREVIIKRRSGFLDSPSFSRATCRMASWLPYLLVVFLLMIGWEQSFKSRYQHLIGTAVTETAKTENLPPPCATVATDGAIEEPSPTPVIKSATTPGLKPIFVVKPFTPTTTGTPDVLKHPRNH